MEPLSRRVETRAGCINGADLATGQMNNSLRGLRKHTRTLENATDPAGVSARQRALELIERIEKLTEGAGI